jgi:hypothetical protein
MKRQLSVAILLLGTACGAGAQDTGNSDTTTINRNVAAEFSASPTESLTLFEAPVSVELPASTSFGPVLLPLLGNAEAEPAPEPKPKFLYGGRDDFRWQLAIGADWFRFR